MIAIALAGEPKLLIADEPTTALDVTIQSQIFELLKKIQQEKALTILLITHDLGLVAGFCDRAYVIEKGEIIEKGSVDHLFYTPKHPFTKNLLQIAKERLSIR